MGSFQISLNWLRRSFYLTQPSYEHTFPHWKGEFEENNRVQNLTAWGIT
jgi:hypothetical protein